MKKINISGHLFPVSRQPDKVEETLAAYLDEVTLSAGQRVLISGDLPSGLIRAACLAQGWQAVESLAANQQFPLIIAYPNGVDGEKQQEDLLSQARRWMAPGGQMLLALGSKHGWARTKEMLRQLGSFEVLANVTVLLGEEDREQLKKWREALDGETRVFRRDRFDNLAEDPAGYTQVVRLVLVTIG